MAAADPRSARKRKSNAQGAVFITVGSVAAVINDGLVRVGTESGLGVYQALFIRGCGVTAILWLAGRIRQERLSRQHFTLPLVVRVIAEVAVACAFFAAVVRIELANAHTILLVVPFVVTAVAARRGEHVSVRRFILVGVGFAGVLAVIRPTPQGFSPWSLLVLVAAASLVVREFATQRIDPATPALPIALVTSAAITVVAGAASAATGWEDVSGGAVAALALACVFLIVGYICAIEAVRIGDLGFSAPFRYSTVIAAVLVGFLFFDEVPDAPTIAGCALVVAAGVLSLGGGDMDTSSARRIRDGER